MATQPMDYIKQTGKTIIFEEFDNTKTSLKTILDSVGDDPSNTPLDDFLENVKNDLEIKTFDEFVQKFAPTFYQIVNKKEDGSPTFSYTTTKPQFKCGVISLKDTNFMNAIFNLIKDKEAGAKTNKQSNYDDFKKQLSPSATIEKMMSIRKSIEYNMKKVFELTEEKKLPKQNVEVQKYMALAYKEFNNAADVYTKDPFLPMLTLRIADIDSQIKQLTNNKSESKSSSDQMAIGYEPSFDENGKIKLIEHSISDSAHLEGDEKSPCSLAIIDTLNSDIEERAPESVKGNNFLRELVVKAFGPSEVSLPKADIQALETEKKQYLEIYNDYTENLINSIIPAVEKFAGVKEFFDHAATENGALADDVSVIISNCKVSSIVNNNKTLNNFRYFFVDALGETTASEEKIWFAVIPAVSIEESENTFSSNETYKRGGFFEGFAENKDTAPKTNEDLVSLNAAKKMLDVLKDARIMTFFNFKACEDTGFAKLTKNKIVGYKKLLQHFDNEYAVFSYPNFTILPKDKNSIEIASVLDEGFEKPVFINLKDGVFLDSAYVAAGMAVGSQNYEIMKDKFSKINRNYPFVRFDFEALSNSKVFTTKLNRETLAGMAKATQDAILQDRFGFVFSDSVLNGISNCYVINSRTLKKDGEYYRSIYQVLVSNFVYQMIKWQCGTVTEQNIKTFESEYSNTWQEDNIFDERKYDNRIFMENERLDTSNIANGEISITFENEQKVQTNLKIKVSRN